jgi:hypothetical protein
MTSPLRESAVRDSNCALSSQKDLSRLENLSGFRVSCSSTSPRSFLFFCPQEVAKLSGQQAALQAAGPMKLAPRWFLAPHASAYRHFFNEGHGIEHRPSNLGRQIIPNTLLPYAIALIEASRLPHQGRGYFDHSAPLQVRALSLLSHFLPRRALVYGIMGRCVLPTMQTAGSSGGTSLGRTSSPAVSAVTWKQSLTKLCYSRNHKDTAHPTTRTQTWARMTLDTLET